MVLEKGNIIVKKKTGERFEVVKIENKIVYVKDVIGTKGVRKR